MLICGWLLAAALSTTPADTPIGALARTGVSAGRFDASTLAPPIIAIPITMIFNMIVAPCILLIIRWHICLAKLILSYLASSNLRKSSH